MSLDEFDKLKPKFDPEEMKKIVELLQEWASVHPKRNEPVLIEMGRTWTPQEIYIEVAEKTELGVEILNFLFVQGRRSEEQPSACVKRAVEAHFS